MYFVAYLDNCRVEVDADNFLSARHNAALLLSTRREDAIHLIECTQNCSLAELQADTEDTNCEYSI